MSEEKKIGIVMLTKFSPKYFELTVEQEAELLKEFQEFGKKWEEKVKLVRNYHSAGTGKFWAILVYEVTDIGDWVAFREEYVRTFPPYLEFEQYIGISTPYFVEATKDVPHYKELWKKVSL